VSPRTLLLTLILCLLPISELRGGLPFALSNDVPLPLAYLICVGANALVSPLVFLFLSSLHKLLERWQPYRRFFEPIPLPITGAYTGTLGAWILGMDRRKTILAVFGGVIIAGIIVATVFTLGIKALYFFLK
jgi:uncharacterized membrane protein